MLYVVGIVGYGVVVFDDLMVGYYDIYWIGVIGGVYCVCGVGMIECFGQLVVVYYLVIGDFV